MIFEDQLPSQPPGHDPHQSAHRDHQQAQASNWPDQDWKARKGERWEPVDNDSDEDDDIWTDDEEEEEESTRAVQAVLDTLEHLSTTIDQNSEDEQPDQNSERDANEADDEGPDRDEVVLDLFSIDNLNSPNEAGSVNGEDEVGSDFGEINVSLHRPEPVLSGVPSVRSLDWDNYASDPTYSQENATTSSLNLS